MHRRPSVWHTVDTLSVGVTSLSPAHSETSMNAVVESQNFKVGKGLRAVPEQAASTQGRIPWEISPPNAAPACVGWVIPLALSLHPHTAERPPPAGL